MLTSVNDEVHELLMELTDFHVEKISRMCNRIYESYARRDTQSRYAAVIIGVRIISQELYQNCRNCNMRVDLIPFIAISLIRVIKTFTQ